ncbi:YheU family protein [Alcanivorax sp. 1008]|uniref:YheU family protein n=1 Tax=Alcanivorax sp. 1008 TaxID=2816853 RepID=UPI001D5C6149|nr:YheU family protein [Alcanivorax sp. 1008]
MIVPWQDIPAESLQNLIEEFVSRDGTDYGEREIPLTTRVDQVREQLRRGKVVIWFDEATETISLFDAERIPEVD